MFHSVVLDPQGGRPIHLIVMFDYLQYVTKHGTHSLTHYKYDVEKTFIVVMHVFKKSSFHNRISDDLNMYTKFSFFSI